MMVEVVDRADGTRKVVSLAFIESAELMRELKRRGVSLRYHSSTGAVSAALAVLREAEIPDDLMDALERWAREPVVSGRDLKRWVERRGIECPSDFATRRG
jgi:hypothetical protein